MSEEKALNNANNSVLIALIGELSNNTHNIMIELHNIAVEMKHIRERLEK
jgi:regulator of replication initiation timing